MEIELKHLASLKEQKENNKQYLMKLEHEIVMCEFTKHDDIVVCSFLLGVFTVFFINFIDKRFTVIFLFLFPVLLYLYYKIIDKILDKYKYKSKILLKLELDKKETEIELNEIDKKINELKDKLDNDFIKKYLQKHL